MLNKTEKPRKTTQIGIRLDEPTRAAIQRLADKEHRTETEFVRLLIVEGLKRHKAA